MWMWVSGVFILYVEFDVLDGCSMRVSCKDFRVPEGGGGVVCVLHGGALLELNFASLPTASLLSMLRCVWILWNVRGMFVVIIVGI